MTADPDKISQSKPTTATATPAVPGGSFVATAKCACELRGSCEQRAGTNIYFYFFCGVFLAEKLLKM
jgi:hypothetical protein